MGKLKISHSTGNFPLPPNHIKFSVELIGDAIKIISEDHNIFIKGIDIYERRRNQTKIKFGIDLIYDNLVFEKK